MKLSKKIKQGILSLYYYKKYTMVQENMAKLNCFKVRGYTKTTTICTDLMITKIYYFRKLYDLDYWCEKVSNKLLTND